MKNVYRQFAKVIRQLFVSQGRYVKQRITPSFIRSEKQIDLSAWLEPMQKATRPYISHFAKTGILKQKRRLQKRKKSLLVTKNIYTGWDYVNPYTQQAIDSMNFFFCDATLATSTREINQALSDLRAELREGTSQGDPYHVVGQRVANIFANPYRAQRIAQTEMVRASGAGEILEMQEEGIDRVRWLASSDACDLCLSIDMKEVEVGQSFFIHKKGAVQYRNVLHPPAHPHCFCEITPVL